MIARRGSPGTRTHTTGAAGAEEDLRNSAGAEGETPSEGGPRCGVAAARRSPRGIGGEAAANATPEREVGELGGRKTPSVEVGEEGAGYKSEELNALSLSLSFQSVGVGLRGG